MRKFLRQAIILIVLLFVFNSTDAQNHIKGIVENINQDPLPYSTIHILKSDKATILKSASSNEFGFFEIFLDTVSASKAKYIYARYLGEKSDTLQFLYDKTIKIIIKNGGTISLSEVSISSESPTIVSKSDRFIYTPNKILKEGYSAFELLKMAPLINFDSKSETFTIINKESTVIIINGRKSYLPKEMISALLSTTPAKNIRNIEIITNPGSEYSANTTGGIININLKRNIDEGFLGNFSLASEQTNIFNTSILNSSLNFRKKKIGIRISPFVNRSFNYNSDHDLVINSDGRKENTYGDYERKYFVLGGGFGLDYDINSQNILSINGFISQVNGNSIQDNLTEYSSINQSEIDSIYSSPNQGDDYYLYNFGNVFFQHKLDTIGKRKITFNMDYNQFKKDITSIGSFRKEFPTNIDLNNTYKNIFPQDFINLSGSIDYSLQISEKSKISIGSQISTTNYENDLSYFKSLGSSFELNESLSNKFIYKESYLAGYMNYSKSFSEKIHATFGLRVEGTKYLSENETSGKKIDSSYVNLFPNFSLAYTINEKKVLSLSLAKRIKRPSIESLLPGRKYINPNYFEENNPFLQPVIYYYIDAMYSLNYKYYFSSGFSYRDNQFDQFVIPIFEKGETLQKRTNINYGNSTKTYIQFYTRQKWFNGFWEMNYSSSLNFISFQDETKNLIQTKINSIEYNININNVLYLSQKKKFIAFITLGYYSPTKNVAFERKNSLFKNDLGIKRTFNNLSVALYISDIFDTYGKSQITYSSNQVQLFNQQNRNMLTRSISFTLNYSFGNSNLKEINRKKIANDELKERLD